MIAFEVYVNKVKVCTAGVEDYAAVFSSLASTINPDGPPDEPSLFFSVSGIADKRMFNWVQYQMCVGSEVKIKIVNTNNTDTPEPLPCPGGACDIL
jgi:hypothetical protein